MQTVKVNGRMKQAKETIKFIDEHGVPECDYEVTFKLSINRGQYLMLARAKQIDELLTLTIEMPQQEMPLDALWDQRA